MKRRKALVRGPIDMSTLPKVTPENDVKMKKRVTNLYGGTKFTDEQILYFYTKHKGNATRAAMELRMSPCGYFNRIHTMGLNALGSEGRLISAFTDEQVTLAWELSECNIALTARILGCCYITALNRTRKLNLKPKKQSGLDKRAREAIAMYRKIMSSKAEGK